MPPRRNWVKCNNPLSNSINLTMYNLNVNVNATPASAAGLLSVAAASEVTPRTPEIVNSLIAMTNPFDGFSHNSTGNSCIGGSLRSRDRNDSSSSGGEPSPPSIQTTCSHLIKESLKLTLQTKRRVNGCADDGKKRTRKEDGSADDEEDDESSNSKSINGLTPEDEERRRRRRERNKIAATKCRMKKREKTVILVQESETLETQNHELKSQIQELETQQKRLVDMLQLHRPTCIKQAIPQPHPQDAGYQQQQQQQQQQQPQQYADPVPQLLPSYQDNFAQMNQQQPNLADCGGIVSDYGSVKVEGFEAAFFRQQQQQQQQHQQQNPYTTASTMTTTTNVGSDANGCTV